MKAVMLEIIGDRNEWIWYSVTINTTPRKALLDYIEKNALFDDDEKPKVSKEADGSYTADEVDARAFFFTIEDGAKK